MDEGTGRSRRFGLPRPGPRGTRPQGPGPRRAGLWRAGALAAGLAATALLAAACSGDPSPTSAADTAYQKMLAYSQCMRAHGEPGFPDPQPNGNLLIDGRQNHLNGTMMNSANKACQHLMPKAKPMTAAQQRRVTAQALKFVACMRAHGIPNMPDPVVNAQGVEMRIGGPGSSGPAPNSPVLRAAQQACQKLMPGAP
jgi:hypothetical protein